MENENMEASENDEKIRALFTWFTEKQEGLTTPLYLKTQKRLQMQ
jgi:hypothetical protein